MFNAQHFVKIKAVIFIWHIFWMYEDSLVSNSIASKLARSCYLQAEVHLSKLLLYVERQAKDRFKVNYARHVELSRRTSEDTSDQFVPTFRQIRD